MVCGLASHGYLQHSREPPNGAAVTAGLERGWLVNPSRSDGATEHAKPGLAGGQARASLLGCQLAAACSLADGTM